MTVYSVSIGKNEYQVEISNKCLKINEKPVQAALVELDERGLYSLKKGVKKTELIAKAMGNNQYIMNIDGKHAVVHVEKFTGRTEQPANKQAEGDIKAPISGLVVKVNVKIGDKVEKDDVVLVLESMKMQMLMRTPVSGVVKSLHVTPGSQLAKGDLMVNVE